MNLFVFVFHTFDDHSFQNSMQSFMMCEKRIEKMSIVEVEWIIVLNKKIPPKIQ